MLYLFFLIIGSFLNASFSVQDSVSVLGGIDTNSMFEDVGHKNDKLLRVDPELDFLFDKNGFYSKVGGGIDYNRYFVNTNQTCFKWKFNSLVGVSPEESAKIELVNDYDNNSDPILSDTESRAKWGLYTLKLNTSYTTKDKLWTILGNFESFSTKYDLSKFQNFNNKKRYFVLTSKFFVFPETATLFGFKGGSSFYTAGHDAQPYGNTDSTYYYFFTGLEGKINRDINMDFKLGFLLMDYEYGTSFHEPVLSIKLTDILSPYHSLTASYERMAYDSTYSNFYVDQDIALQFKSIWYDNFVNLSTFQYIYRYYRLAPKRIDNILAFATEFTFPMMILRGIGENISFMVKFMAEWVNSDAYNSFGYYTGPDPSASYKRAVLLVGLTTKY